MQIKRSYADNIPEFPEGQDYCKDLTISYDPAAIINPIPARNNRNISSK
jgi:hypothetical protein